MRSSVSALVVESVCENSSRYASPRSRLALMRRPLDEVPQRAHVARFERRILDRGVSEVAARGAIAVHVHPLRGKRRRRKGENAILELARAVGLMPLPVLLRGAQQHGWLLGPKAEQ